MNKTDAPADLYFRTADDPEANGRAPQHGDTKWTIFLPLENGARLHVSMGKKGRDLLFGMLIAERVDSGEPEPTEHDPNAARVAIDKALVLLRVAMRNLSDIGAVRTISDAMDVLENAQNQKGA